MWMRIGSLALRQTGNDVIDHAIDDVMVKWPWSGVKWPWWPLTLMTFDLGPDMTSSITWWITWLMMSWSSGLWSGVKWPWSRVKWSPCPQGQVKITDWLINGSSALWWLVKCPLMTLDLIWRHQSRDWSRDWWCHGQVTLIRGRVTWRVKWSPCP